MERLYWFCQIGGWGVYAILLSLYYQLSDSLELNPGAAISIILTSATALGITHLFREIVHSYDWHRLAIGRLMGQVLLANICMAICFFGLNVLIDRVTGNYAGTLSEGVVFVSIINGTIIFLLWSLMYFSAHLFRDYRKREIEHLKWESAIKDFELNKLKSQLNPHFVFNALNSIRALVDEDPAKAKISITQLSNILRNSLIADRNKTISFSEELRTVNDYLNLEKLRYEERLNVKMNINPDVLGVQVPPMMVQTIVENAVKHGISQVMGRGFIEVEAHLDKQAIDINIRNSGQLKTTDNPTGFGLINTKQRLELLYGANHRFAISQEADNTVNVNLSFPIK